MITDKKFILSYREKVRLAALEATVELFKVHGGNSFRASDKPADIFAKTTLFAEQFEAWIMAADAVMPARTFQGSGEWNAPFIPCREATKTALGKLMATGAEADVARASDAGGGNSGKSGGGGGGRDGFVIVESAEGARRRIADQKAAQIDEVDEGAAELPADHVRFEWLRQWLAGQGCPGVYGTDVTRKGLIAAYYAVICQKTGMPSFARPGGFRPSLDHLAMDEDGYIHRWEADRFWPNDKGEWIAIDELPGYRLADGVIRWAPGTWPPMGEDL